MNSKLLSFVCLILLAVSCRKETDPIDPPAPPEPPQLDIPTVRLKDWNVEKIPSPNYHFNYNDSGYITQLSYASGLISYDVSYSGGKILKLEANKDAVLDINKDKLEYDYTDGYVTTIRVINKHGLFYRKCSLTYLPSHLLQQVKWEVDPGPGFSPEQTLDFTYYPDSNLKEIAYHNFLVGPQVESIYSDKFENYDDKINVDGFSLMHTNTHHPIILPLIKLQVNNPGRHFRTGQNTPTFDANYTYTSDASGRPLTRTGLIKFNDTNGKTGEIISKSTYTYN